MFTISLSAGFAWGTNFASTIRMFFKPTGMFFPSVKMPEGATALMDKALDTTDFETQKALNQELSKMLVDDCTVMAICSDALGFITSPRVHGGHWLEGADWEYWSPVDTWISSK